MPPSLADGGQGECASRGEEGGVNEGDSDDGGCTICMERGSTHVIVPCGHKCVCDQCARGYRAGSNCPICRGRVQSVVRVFD